MSQLNRNIHLLVGICAIDNYACIQFTEHLAHSMMEELLPTQSNRRTADSNTSRLVFNFGTNDLALPHEGMWSHGGNQCKRTMSDALTTARFKTY